MNSRVRTGLLLIGLVSIGGLTVFDRGARSGDVADDAGPASRYVREAALAGDMAAALAESEAWEQAAADAEGAFAQVAERLLIGESEDIVFVRLREIVRAEMADLGLVVSGASALDAATPLANEPIRVIGLHLEFE